MADRKITVAIDADATGLRRGVAAAEKQAGGLRGAFGKLSSGLGSLPGIGLAAGAVAGLTAGLVESIQAAADEEQAVAKLAAVLGKALPEASAAAKAAIDEQVASMQYGSSFTDDQLRPAYGNLVAVVRDQESAFTLLQAAMDLATAKGIPLETATKAVAKAADGNTAALHKLAPELDANALKGADAAAVAQLLATKFGGVDKAAADTANGRLKDLQKRFEDVQEKVGQALLPALEDFTDWAASPDGKRAIEDMSDVVAGLAGALGAVAGIVGPLIGKLQELNDALRSLPNAGTPLENIRDWLGLQALPAGTGQAAAAGPAAYGVGTSRAASRSAAPVTVNVSGALDPEGVARALERVLSSHATRVGRAPFTPRAAAW